jgi:hypothetical protein
MSAFQPISPSTSPQLKGPPQQPTSISPQLKGPPQPPTSTSPTGITPAQTERFQREQGILLYFRANIKFDTIKRNAFFNYFGTDVTSLDAESCDNILHDNIRRMSIQELTDLNNYMKKAPSPVARVPTPVARAPTPPTPPPVPPSPSTVQKNADIDSIKTYLEQQKTSVKKTAFLRNFFKYEHVYQASYSVELNSILDPMTPAQVHAKLVEIQKTLTKPLFKK